MWIEIDEIAAYILVKDVTPCAGVWIEMLQLIFARKGRYVTPCAGVWIEITIWFDIAQYEPSHSLCGSVD